MGFWGDVVNGMLEGDGTFGMKFRRSDEKFRQLYEMLYFDFGLVPPRNLRDGTMVPVTTISGWDGKLLKFEVHGSPNSARHFLYSGWGNLFNKISREIPIPNNKTWIYDITRLNEGKLVGETVHSSDFKVPQSQEYLNLLQIVGAGMMKPLSGVPAIRLEFGEIWEQFRIPDYIDITLDSLYPFSDNEFHRLIELIIHNYRNRNAPVSYGYSANPLNGTLKITVTKKVEEVPPQPQHQPQSGQPSQETGPGGFSSLGDFINNLNNFVDSAQQNNAPPDDGFPYEFYRGLGLIDDEDMVLINTILGPMRVHMQTENAREHLLAYKP